MWNYLLGHLRILSLKTQKAPCTEAEGPRHSWPRLKSWPVAVCFLVPALSIKGQENHLPHTPEGQLSGQMNGPKLKVQFVRYSDM